MDPLTLSVAVGAGAVAGLGAWLQARRRAQHADEQAARLRLQVQDQRQAVDHDPLTGLPNLKAFHQSGAALLADPGQPPLVGVVLELDNLQEITASLGRPACDEVVLTVARRLAAYAGDNLIAQLGRGQFAGLFSSGNSDWCWPYPAGAWLAEALAAPMRIAGQKVTADATIGLAPVHGFTRLPEVLRRADRALYRARSTGKRHACFDPVLDETEASRPGPPPARGRDQEPDQYFTNAGHWLDEPRSPVAVGRARAAWG
jgi:diguanylate cyclase